MKARAAGLTQDPDISLAEYGVKAVRRSEAADGLPLTPLLTERVPLSELLIDLTADDGDEVDWVVPGWIPRGECTLLSGHGSSGKTTLALQWSVALAAGIPFLGCGRRGRVLVWSAEDRPKTTRRRIKKYCERNGIDRETLAVDVLNVRGGRGLLWREGRVEGLQTAYRTSAFDELEQFVLAAHATGNGYDLVLIDNISDVYGANESDRGQVRAFVQELAQLADEAELAVLLIGHLQKAAVGKGTTEQYSGSTAWHNSARSRISLEKDSDGYGKLVHHKSNLGPLQDPVLLVMDDELFLIDNHRARAEDTATEDDAAVLATVLAAHATGAKVSTGEAGAYSAWSTLRNFDELPEPLRRREGRQRVIRALNRLTRSGALTRTTYKNQYRHDREIFIPGKNAPTAPTVTDAVLTR